MTMAFPQTDAQWAQYHADEQHRADSLGNGIMTTRAVKAWARHGGIARPGGYQMFVLMADNEALCFGCLKTEYREIYRAMRETERNCLAPDDAQWTVSAVDVNWEDTDMYCAHCNERIPSAYADADA